MITCKELLKGNEVIVALTHLLTCNGNHIVVHPVAHALFAQGSAALCNLCLVVREHEVHATTVNIELLTQILGTHSRTLHVPTREAFAPRAGPVHYVLRCSLFPESKVEAVLLLLLSVEFAGLGDNILEVTAREFAIRIILGVLLDVHIDATIAHVGIALVHDLLHKSNLLNDMSAGMWLNRRWQDIQECHVAVVAVGEVLHHLHRLELLKAGFLSNLIFALVGIVLQVANIGDIAHIAHFIAEVLEIAVQ